MQLWRCGVCGYVHDGKEAPDKCPKCGAPKEQFSEIEKNAAALIERSRKTNDLHVALMAKYKKIEKIAREIKEDNLDPPCVAIAERAIKDSHETIQAIKAEIEGHQKKGKWG